MGNLAAAMDFRRDVVTNAIKEQIRDAIREAPLKGLIIVALEVAGRAPSCAASATNCPPIGSNRMQSCSSGTFIVPEIGIRRHGTGDGLATFRKLRKTRPYWSW